MKKTLTLILITAFALSCKKENTPEKFTIAKLAGNYSGTFFTCGAKECKTADTTFSIVNRDNKTFLKFGEIEDQIEFVDNSNTIYSANITWNASGTTGSYGITGNYKNDSLHLLIGSIYMPDDIYKNNLVGARH
ncbi:MAG: hypothetical protein ACKVQB_08515 [Bacteroidia bacterium]